MRLEAFEQPIPFDVREGGAHRRARFTAVNERPRAEDLLVFSCIVPPEEWVRVQVFEGACAASEHGEHLRRENGRCMIAYPGMTAVVEEESGRLLEFDRDGELLLTGPMAIDALKLTDENPYTFSGEFAAGYADRADPNSPRITPGASEAAAGRAALKFAHSSDAMTELGFLIEMDMDWQNRSRRLRSAFRKQWLPFRKRTQPEDPLFHPCRLQPISRSVFPGVAGDVSNRRARVDPRRQRRFVHVRAL